MRLHRIPRQCRTYMDEWMMMAGRFHQGTEGWDLQPVRGWRQRGCSTDRAGHRGRPLSSRGEDPVPRQGFLVLRAVYSQFGDLARVGVAPDAQGHRRIVLAPMGMAQGGL